MSKKTFLGLALVILLILVTIPMSSAKGVEYRANGKDLSYPNPDPNPSSVVVGGNWNIKVKDGKVDFNLFYKELNLIPELEGGAPAGSVDHFYMSLIEAWDIEIQPHGICFVHGLFNIDKLAWMPEGSTPPIDHIYNFLGNQEGWFLITPDGLELHAGPWNLIGSTTTIHQ